MCLEWQNHARGVELQVIGHISSQHSLDWPTITEEARRMLRDPRDATEFGATAIAIMLSKNELGYPAVERSRQGTGIDYWMGYEDGNLFIRQAQLEVSGILKARGNVARKVRERVNEKLKQTEQSTSQLPIYVIVVEFGSPIARVQKR